MPPVLDFNSKQSFYNLVYYVMRLKCVFGVNVGGCSVATEDVPAWP